MEIRFNISLDLTYIDKHITFIYESMEKVLMVGLVALEGL